MMVGGIGLVGGLHKVGFIGNEEEGWYGIWLEGVVGCTGDDDNDDDGPLVVGLGE